MFGWLKPKNTQRLSPDFHGIANKIIGPSAQVLALAECVRDYVKAVELGEVEYPAHRRKNASILAVWNDVRLEAFHRAFNFGQADLMMLANVRKQSALLECFLEERPQFELPQPRGEPIADTLQAVWQVYLYLDSVGTAVADQTTDRYSLKSRNQDILFELNKKALAIRLNWTAFESSMKVTSQSQTQTEIPKMFFEIIWDDVTLKSKSIAISKVYGPDQEGGMRYVLNLLSENASEKDILEMRAIFDRLRVAKEPEDIRKSG